MFGLMVMWAVFVMMLIICSPIPLFFMVWVVERMYRKKDEELFDDKKTK